MINYFEMKCRLQFFLKITFIEWSLFYNVNISMYGTQMIFFRNENSLCDRLWPIYINNFEDEYNHVKFVSVYSYIFL